MINHEDFYREEDLLIPLNYIFILFFFFIKRLLSFVISDFSRRDTLNTVENERTPAFFVDIVNSDKRK